MALFNVTNKRANDYPIEARSFRASNGNISVSTRQALRVSETVITEQQWLGNL